MSELNRQEEKRSRKWTGRPCVRMYLTRIVSLHERYSICRRNCGFPIPNTIILSYPSSHLAPSRKHLDNRIRELLVKFPLLNAEIRGSQTKNPYFAPRATTLTPGDILSEQILEDGTTRDEVLVSAIRSAEFADLDGPLWQVIRHSFTSTLTSTSTSSSNSSPTYLSISAQHELLDGIGLLRLMHALTSDSIDKLPSEPFETPVGMSTPEYKPSISFLLPLIYTEMIIPALPTWLQSYLRPTPAWPFKIDLHPSKAPWASSTLSLDPEQITKISQAGKSNNVKTLHPILKVAYLLAIRSVYGNDVDVDAGAKVKALGAKFIGQSPRNERDPSLGHPWMTGNYTSSFEWTLPSNGTFWTAARECYQYGISPPAISSGRQKMGTLAYLPDPDPSDSTASDDPKRATGWEDHYTTKFESGVNPYTESLSISNLGRTTLPPGATDLIWGLPGSPFAPPFSVAMIGHEGGLRVYTTWREGCPVTLDAARKVEHVFVDILTRATNGDGVQL